MEIIKTDIPNSNFRLNGDMAIMPMDDWIRGGKKHCNHGDTVEKMVRHVVQKIRTKYRSDVPIIFKMDSGFFDQKLFEVFEELGVGYVVSGKLLLTRIAQFMC